MLSVFLDKINVISPVFYQVLYLTIIGSMAGAAIYFIRCVLDKKISAKCKCLMWCMVLITLLIPFRFEIKTEQNIIESGLIDRVEDIKYIANDNTLYTWEEESKAIPEDTLIAVDTNQIIKLSVSVKALFMDIIIPYIWLAGTAICALIFFIGAIKTGRRISECVYNDERTDNILQMCKSQLNIKGNIRIVLQNGRKSPSIFGIFKPSILISEKNLREDNETLKYIFLHELAHYKRKDILFNYILLFVLAVHWFNPFVWFLFKKIRQDIELGADELVSVRLNKAEKKQYGMVLIKMLRNQPEEHHASSLLCISDTGKNMERRIHMLKGKSKSIILSLSAVAVVAAVVLCAVFLKGSSQSASKINDDEVLGYEAISGYVDIICNRNALINRLPVFDDINEADKTWIYSHITRNEDVYYLTEDEIKEDLQKIFGADLVIDVEKDISSTDDISMPLYIEEEGKYMLPAFGVDTVIKYALDSYEEADGKCIVNVIEYVISYDNEKNENCIASYDAAGNMKEIFRTGAAESEDAVAEHNLDIENDVRSRKEEFQSFNITIEKDSDDLFNVTKIEKV